jgi:hypothetical protein
MKIKSQLKSGRLTSNENQTMASVSGPRPR